MSDNFEKSGIFINGKAQIIEMLQFMPQAEKEKLLKAVQYKNPTLAAELSEKSFSFNDLISLNEHDFDMVSRAVNPAVIGLALKFCNQSLQRKFLGSIAREYAQKAYQVMKTPIATEKEDCARAQKKIIETVLSLKKKGHI